MSVAGVCTAPGEDGVGICGREVRARGFCNSHRLAAKAGRPLVPLRRYKFGMRTETKCEHCGRDFMPKRRESSTFCSRDCSFASKTAASEAREAANPSQKTTKAEREGGVDGPTALKGGRVRIGAKFGRLTVLKISPDARSRVVLCRCDCGTEKWVSRAALGKTVSCGCRTSEMQRERQGRFAAERAKPKKCWVCEADLTADDRLKRHSRCRDCRNAVARDTSAGVPSKSSERRHGQVWASKGLKNANGSPFTKADYERLLAEQGGCCAICRRPKANMLRRFAVDHDHKFMHVRGLLCGSCNVAIGHLGDSPTTLRAAIAYLERHQPRLLEVGA